MIGEPLVAPEPLLAARHVAEVMGVSTQRVYLLARAEVLPVEPGHRERRYRLRDAEKLAGAITPHQAAEILGITVAETRALIANGVFTETGEPLRPVRRWEAEWQRLLQKKVRRRNQPPPDQCSASSETSVAELDSTSRTTFPELEAQLLTLGEAAQILGVTAMTVHRMASEGLLDRADPHPLRNRQITRSSVDRVAIDWGRRITRGAAAAMLSVGADKIAELLRSGVLTRHRYSPNPIAIDDVQHLITTGALTDPVHHGRIPAREAAQRLGVSGEVVSWRARRGRIPAVKDRLGTWWLRPRDVNAYARARAAEQSKIID